MVKISNIYEATAELNNIVKVDCQVVLQGSRDKKK